jgi:predicted secreted protein
MAIHSKLTVFKLDNASAALTDISSYCNKVELPTELDLKEVTVFGSTARQWLPGFGDGDIKIGGPWTRAQDSFFTLISAAFQAGTLASVSFEYGPEGADSSDRKLTGEAILTNYQVSSDVDSPVEWSADLKVTGGITFTTY